MKDVILLGQHSTPETDSHIRKNILIWLFGLNNHNTE